MPRLLHHISVRYLLGRGRAFLGCRRYTLRQSDRQKSAVPRLKISKKITFVDLNS